MEFEALYGRYARRLHGWAFRRTRAAADADDLIQDAFLAIHLSLPGFRGESDLDAWVFGVARNVWRVQTRAAGRLDRRRWRDGSGPLRRRGRPVAHRRQALRGRALGPPSRFDARDLEPLRLRQANLRTGPGGAGATVDRLAPPDA